MNTNIFNTKLKGVFLIENQSFSDERGSFLNIFRSNEECYQRIWGGRSLNQINISRNSKLGTTRGMHCQLGEFSEAKLVNCLMGKVFDVILDLRKESETFGEWISIILSSKKQNAVFIPEGCAHGFQTLENNSEIIYIHSGNWVKNSESGVRWDDPSVAIKWPMSPTVISKKDLLLPLLQEP